MPAHLTGLEMKKEGNSAKAATVSPIDLLRAAAPLSWRAYFLSHMIVKPVHVFVTERYGITWIEWRIIFSLAHAPGLAANEITSAWAFDKMTVSRAVRRLLELKMVKRGIDPKDSRRSPLYLDRKGQAFFDRLWPGAQQHYRDITSALAPGEFETFCRIADKLIERTVEISKRDSGRKQTAGPATARAKRTKA